MAIRKLVRWDWNGASEVFHKHGEQTHSVSQSWPLGAAALAVFFENGLWVRNWRAKVHAILEVVSALGRRGPSKSPPGGLAPPSVPGATSPLERHPEPSMAQK